MDLKRLQDIIDILEERSISEFELEEEGVRIRLKRSVSPPMTSSVQAVPAAVSYPQTPSIPAASALREVVKAEAKAGEDEGLTTIVSPIVGTFYRAPDPNSAPFVEVGDRVRIGQVLCIVEAMKLMNEIEAETAGVIVKIHQENGQPVQYGAPLFSVRPD